MKSGLEDLLAVAGRLAAGQPRLRDTVLKEILHRDILAALHRSGLARNLVFQGGTALRLCYGNPRYSEDLDFVRNTELDGEAFDAFKKELKRYLADRYGLGVRIAEPKKPLAQRTTPEQVVVHRWVITVEIEDTRVRNQKIHIEVADVPAYDARPRTIQSPYQELGGRPAVMQVSSLNEILADKIIAVAGRPYIKARDIWDIKWLVDKGAKARLDWVRAKARDYHLSANGDMTPVIARLAEKIRTLPQPETLKKFREEMSRFLDQEQASTWIDNDLNMQALVMEVGEYLETQSARLRAPDSDSSTAGDLAERLKAWKEKHGAAEKTVDNPREPE